MEEISEPFRWFDSLVASLVQLTVSAGTALTLNVEMGEDAFCHVFSGRLLSDGAGVPNKLVKIAVNGSVKDDMCTSSPSGEFSFTLNLPPVNNRATGYQIQVMFEGDSYSNATAYSKVNGTDYAVCTTIQYGYKPSTNSTWLTVEPQATQMATTTKTPEQTQAEAEGSGQLITKLKFSWWNPWFWLETTTSYPESQTTLVTCTSIFGGWTESCNGLENPLYKIFEGASPQQIEILTSAAISSITLAAATFIGGYIAAKATEWNPLAYLVAMGVYFAGGFLVLSGISLLLDAYTARAILVAAGWALLALSTLGFTKTIPIYLSNIAGSDPVTASIKCIINTLLGVAITTAILKALGVSIGGFLFYLFTFILGITALSLGYSRV